MFKKKMPWTSNALVDLYNYTNSGHYFDKDTMRFFKSKVTDYFERIDDNTALFITTEKGPTEHSKRRASIRFAILTHLTSSDGIIRTKVNITTCGDFNTMTMQAARKKLKEVAEKLKNKETI